MKVLVIGATGRVGSRVLAVVLRSGHEAVALVRDPGKLTVSHPKLTVRKGDVLNKDDIDSAMRGVDCVVSCLSVAGTDTLSRSMPLIIDAMKAAGAQRIVTVGTSGILQSRTDPSRLRYQTPESRRSDAFPAKEHRKVYECLLSSDLRCRSMSTFSFATRSTRSTFSSLIWNSFSAVTLTMS